MLNDRKGQALLEMAILGSLIFVVLGALLSIGCSLREQQTLLMQSFRKSLQKSYDENAFVSYNIMKNVRAPNPTGGPNEGVRLSASGGASTFWVLGEPEAYAYVKVNEAGEERLKEKDEEIVSIDNMLFDSNSFYKANVVNGNYNGSISDEITTTLVMDDGSNLVFDQTLGADGRYQ